MARVGPLRLLICNRESIDAHQCWLRTACNSYFMPDVHQLPEKWLPVSIAPADTDLEVCVIDKNGVHALIFPVRKNGTKWLDAGRTNNLIDIEPTHWRKWSHGADT